MKTAFALPLVLTLLLATAPCGAMAGDDHDRARSAVQAGQVLPLRTILDNVARDYPGDVIETELEDMHGAPVYEIKLISPEGMVMKLVYDARDGTLLKAKGKHK
ncbi:MAG: PepSY domain-containing protein [Bacteroidota bacterium]